MSYEENQKPTAAFVLSLIGSIISFVASFIFLAIAFSWRPSYYYSYFNPFAIFGIVGAWFIVSAIIVLIGSIILYQQPEKHRNWGIIILVFSVLGGGGILGIIGGALAIAWKPIPHTIPTPVQEISRICPQCGRVLTQEVKFCPYCGKELG